MTTLSCKPQSACKYYDKGSDIELSDSDDTDNVSLMTLASLILNNTKKDDSRNPNPQTPPRLSLEKCQVDFPVSEHSYTVQTDPHISTDVDTNINETCSTEVNRSEVDTELLLDDVEYDYEIPHDVLITECVELETNNSGCENEIAKLLSNNDTCGIDDLNISQIEAFTDNALSENDETMVLDNSESSKEPDDGPTEIRPSRRRKGNENEWKVNIRKRKRARGEEYVSVKGKRIRNKEFKSTNCRCKFKCSSNIPNERRQDIFQTYWSRPYEFQREFIQQNVKMLTTKRKTTTASTRRKNTIEYFLPSDETKIQVCKKTFLNTIDIGERTVFYTLKRRRSDCRDKRGKHPPTNKIPESERERIREHIKSFPVIDSHYCRKSTGRRYLDKNLSIRKMYDLYCAECNSKGIEAQKLWLYDTIFGTEFNLGFHTPKKDACLFCETFNKLSLEEQEEIKDEYARHQDRKQQARDKKADDKLRSMADPLIKTLNFDLQKVLITPKTNVGDVYYSRKLATYNFTIFDLVSKECVCNMWWESVAKRGSNEIASCIYKYINTLGAVNELNYYSDSCTGQQRNLPFSVMCLYSVVNLPIKTINHFYFERGHSQMEGDSVHATIENATKKSEIFAPSEWMSAVRNAKRSKPTYDVKQLQNEDVLDFKDLALKTVSNRNKTSDGQIVHWNKIHAFQYRKNTPSKIFFKSEINNSDFLELDIHSVLLRKGGRQQVRGYNLKRAYTGLLPISELKFKDLQSLCKKGIIPEVHRQFYGEIPHSGTALDRLPEPNESDDSDIGF